MTRRDYVIVSTTGTILFLISIPWFLLVKNHLMLEPPYFRVDPSFVQHEQGSQGLLAETRQSVQRAAQDTQEHVVVNRPVPRVQLVNLPTARVGALVHVEPPPSRAPVKQESSGHSGEKAESLQAAPMASPRVAKKSVASIKQPMQQRSSRQSTTNQAGPELYGIQVGAFRRQANAKELARTYENKVTQIHIVTSDSRGKRWYRVILGGFPDRQAAVEFGQALKAVRGEMQTQLVSFKPPSQSGSGDSR